MSLDTYLAMALPPVLQFPLSPTGGTGSCHGTTTSSYLLVETGPSGSSGGTEEAIGLKGMSRGYYKNQWGGRDWLEIPKGLPRETRLEVCLEGKTKKSRGRGETRQ